MHPSSVEAHCMPIPSNICRANNGKAAPHRLRRKVFAAIAEAANYSNELEEASWGGALEAYHQIRINKVVESLQEDTQESETNEEPA